MPDCRGWSWHRAGHCRYAFAAGRSLCSARGRSSGVQRRIGFGRALAMLAILAGVAAMMATGPGASASTTTVTIHKAWCSTTAKDLFDECHDNRVAGIGFTIAGRGLVTNGSGVTGTAVTPG